MNVDSPTATVALSRSHNITVKTAFGSPLLSVVAIGINLCFSNMSLVSSDTLTDVLPPSACIDVWLTVY